VKEPDFRALMALHGVPPPRAIEMVTEVRSDGGLQFQLLQAPYWTGDGGTAIMAVWTCQLQVNYLHDLWRYLLEPDADTGLQPEAVINRALRDCGYGSYLGTFVADGPPPTTVRMVFAYQPTKNYTLHQLNGKLSELYGSDTPAGAALRKLRAFWQINGQPDQSWMMLSQKDLTGDLANPFVSPFTASQYRADLALEQSAADTTTARRTRRRRPGRQQNDQASSDD
jgi:hypothetical protein